MTTVANLARYYPAEAYYSYQRSRNPFVRAAHVMRARSYFHSSVLGKYIAKRFPRPDLEAIAALRPSRDWKILDVGCGSGKLLLELEVAGFRRLCGVDPFTPRPVNTPHVSIRKCELDEVEEAGWDLVMFHHVLEHVSDPEKTLKVVARLLAPNGVCLVRIPVVGWAWRHYRHNWVQLDAPRHVFLHSERSLLDVAGRAGLQVVDTRYDSDGFQFWGSELYQKGVPLSKKDLRKGVFTRTQLNRYARWAARLNRKRMGDQASFVLRKGPSAAREAVPAPVCGMS